MSAQIGKDQSRNAKAQKGLQMNVTEYQCKFEKIVGQMDNGSRPDSYVNIEVQAEYRKHNSSQSKAGEECKSGCEEHRKSDNRIFHADKKRIFGGE